MHGTGGLGGGAESWKLTNSGVRSYSATKFRARRSSIKIETERPAAAEISNLPCQSIKSNQRSGAGEPPASCGSREREKKGEGGGRRTCRERGGERRAGGAGRRAAEEGDRGRLRGRRGEPSRGGARGAGRRRAEAEPNPRRQAGARPHARRHARARPGRDGIWMWPGWWMVLVESSRHRLLVVACLGAPPPLII